MRALVVSFITMILSVALHAASGEVSIFVMQDGKPMADAKIIIDDKISLTTDSDGSAFYKLDIGKHQAVIDVQEAGKSIAFARHNFIIAPDQNTEVIITLNQSGAVENIDVEATADAANYADSNGSMDDTNYAKGILQGLILSGEDNKPLKGVRIFVKGISAQALSNSDGNFTLALREGNHTITILHNKFSVKSVDITIDANKTVAQTIVLQLAGMELEEFVVLKPRVEGTLASTVAEKRNSDAVADITGSEQMSKQGDSNAAAALKRVAGLTIIGGKDIYVRGLGDRYASVELNQMPLPSPNPLKRVVPLDVFPAGVIGSLQVQKSFSSDIPGTFGGGYINIRTKDAIDEDYVELTLGMSAHSSIGQASYGYEQSGSSSIAMSDALIDFGTINEGSSISSVGEASDATIAALKKDLTDRTLSVTNQTVPMGGNIGLEISKNYAYKKHKFSVLANYAYSQKSKNVAYEKYRFEVANSQTGTLDTLPTSESIQNTSTTTIQHGGMLNTNYEYKDFKFKYTKFFVLNTILQTRFNEGTFGENTTDQKIYNLGYEERLINTDQFNTNVEYHFLTDMVFDAGYEYATASQYQPSDVSYTYTLTSGDYVLNSNYGNIEIENISSEDALHNYYLKNKMSTPLFHKDDYIEVGLNREKKSRVASTISYAIKENISNSEASQEIDAILANNDDWFLYLNSNEKDMYNADLDRQGVYVKSTFQPFEGFNINLGLRSVNLSQTITRYVIEDDIAVKDPRELALEKSLPSLGFKYKINDKNQLRFVYYKSFIVPDFREFVPTTFAHPTQRALISGNEDLVETDISSYDLRYEFYFDDVDNITVAYFYKNLENPIEDTQEFSSSGLTKYTYANAASAVMHGFETSWNKNLGFLATFLDEFSISGNYTYILSSVTLTEQQEEDYVTQDRQLQGLSPQILNLSMQYDAGERRSLSISYNHMATRLMKVAIKNGSTIMGDDDYEIPSDTLDFVWIERFHLFDTDSNLKLKVGNILDGETVWQQQNKTTFKYSKGRTVSLSWGMRY